MTTNTPTTAATLIRNLVDQYPSRFTVDLSPNGGPWSVFDHETQTTTVYNRDGSVESGQLDPLLLVRRRGDLQHCTGCGNWCSRYLNTCPTCCGVAEA